MTWLFFLFGVTLIVGTLLQRVADSSPVDGLISDDEDSS